MKQQTRKRAHHHPTLMTDSGLRQTSFVLSVSSRRTKSTGSKTSRADLRREENKWLQPQEYLLLLIEATMSLAAYVISERNFSSEELLRMGLTKIQFSVFSLFTNGFSALVSMFIGVIADSYLTHYTCSLLTVILHFSVVSLVFMEVLIRSSRDSDENIYAGPLSNVCIVTTVLIKSSNFTRLVYALEGMTGRKKSTIYTFIFLHVWVSSYTAEGGIIVNVFSGLFNYFDIHLAMLAFFLTGFSLFLFVYLMSPETQWKEQAGLGCSLIGCLFLATFYTVFRIKKQNKRGFLEITERTYKKTTISRTKEIFVFYALIMPVFAVLFFTTCPVDLFLGPLTERIKPDTLINTFGLTQLARAILATGMLLSYLFLRPLLNMSIKTNVRVQFLTGNFIMALCWFYAAGVMRTAEKFQYAFGDGFVRVFNARDSPVHFETLDKDFSMHNFTVMPRKGMMLAYPVPVIGDVSWLFPMLASFEGTKTKLSVFLSVRNRATIGYMILDPPEVVRIRGYLPLREGPPGTNVRFWPHIYVYNTAKTLYGAKLQVTYPRTNRIIKELTLTPGKMLTIALEGGASYDFVIPQADIRRTVNLEEGGLYGIMIYSLKSHRQLRVDVVRDGNTASVWAYLGMYFFLGVAESFTYPSIRIITFNIAPRGLLAMCFAFLAFMEGIALWVSYIGFVTWHKYMTSLILFAYASAGAGFFFICMFVLLKYRSMYY